MVVFKYFYISEYGISTIIAVPSEGLIWALVYSSVEDKEMLEKIEEYVTKKIKVLDISKNDYHDIMFSTEEKADSIAEDICCIWSE